MEFFRLLNKVKAVNTKIPVTKTKDVKRGVDLLVELDNVLFSDVEGRSDTILVDEVSVFVKEPII